MADKRLENYGILLQSHRTPHKCFLRIATFGTAQELISFLHQRQP